MAELEAAAAVLRNAGVDVEMAPTESAESTGPQARAAALSGRDVVFACGGDGTIHDVLQGMVGLPNECALGVIPMGTANALASDLGIPRRPAEAARFALQLSPRRIPAGRMDFTTSAGESAMRYFTVMAGAGPDGALLYKMRAKAKHRLGMLAYYIRSVLVASSQLFPPFEVEFTETKTGRVRREVVTQAMAVRITDFGNVLRRLVHGAALEREDLRLALFKAPIRITLSLHLFSTFLGQHWSIPGVEVVDATEVSCRHLPNTKRKIYTEADGELLGSMPVRFSVVPNAYTLLMPRRESLKS